jgi:hypothetical protein
MTATRTDGNLGDALTPPHSGYFSMPCAKAYLHDTTGATPIASRANVLPWGVTVEGGTLGDVVNVIVRGVAPVRLRSMTYSGGPGHNYAVPSIRRSSQEDGALLRGILETTQCACDNAASILYIDGSTVATSGGSETAKVFWSLVII